MRRNRKNLLSLSVDPALVPKNLPKPSVDPVLVPSHIRPPLGKVEYVIDGTWDSKLDGSPVISEAKVKGKESLKLGPAKTLWTAKVCKSYLPYIFK